MSVKVSMQVRRRDAETLENVYRTYNNINGDYVGLAPYPLTPPELPFVTTAEYDETEEETTSTTRKVTSYAEWCDTVARQLGTLTDDTYVQTVINASFTEYVGGVDNG